MKSPKPSRRAALNEWGAWRQRALMAEQALRIMVLTPNSKEADAIRESAKAAYAKHGREIPSENPAPIGGQSSLPSTDPAYGLHRAGRVEVQE